MDYRCHYNNMVLVRVLCFLSEFTGHNFNFSKNYNAILDNDVNDVQFDVYDQVIVRIAKKSH